MTRSHRRTVDDERLGVAMGRGLLFVVNRLLEDGLCGWCSGGHFLVWVRFLLL